MATNEILTWAKLLVRARGQVLAAFHRASPKSLRMFSGLEFSQKSTVPYCSLPEQSTHLRVPITVYTPYLRAYIGSREPIEVHSTCVVVCAAVWRVRVPLTDKRLGSISWFCNWARVVGAVCGVVRYSTTVTIPKGASLRFKGATRNSRKRIPECKVRRSDRACIHTCCAQACAH